MTDELDGRDLVSVVPGFLAVRRKSRLLSDIIGDVDVAPGESATVEVRPNNPKPDVTRCACGARKKRESKTCRACHRRSVPFAGLVLTCESCGTVLSRARALAVARGQGKCVCSKTCFDLMRLQPERLCVDCGADITGNHKTSTRCGDCGRRAAGARAAAMTPEQRAEVSAKVRAYWAARPRSKSPTPPHAPCVDCGGEVRKLTATRCAACSRKRPRQLSDEARARISEGMRRAWQRPEYQESRAAGLEAAGRKRRQIKVDR